jgi:hypothetical protein
LVCGANDVAREQTLSYAAVTVRRRVAPGEEPRSVSDTRGGAMSEPMLDAAGRRRSPATLPEFHAGRPPRNKGMRYPADPPTIEEIVAVMRRAGDGVHGRRLRGLIVCAVARRPADLRGARARRGRPGRAPRIAAGAARLAISGLLVTVHPPPYGPTGLALFILAVLLYVRSRTGVRAPGALGQTRTA